MPGIVNPRSKIQFGNNQEMIYSEADTGSDCLFLIRFRDLSGSSVHAHIKYCFNRLFCQNIHNNRDSGMQFSSVMFVLISATS
jgi:hypothetical protein